MVPKMNQLQKCPTLLFVAVQTGPNVRVIGPSIVNEHGDNQQI